MIRQATSAHSVRSETINILGQTTCNDMYVYITLTRTKTTRNSERFLRKDQREVAEVGDGESVREFKGFWNYCSPVRISSTLTTTRSSLSDARHLRRMIALLLLTHLFKGGRLQKAFDLGRVSFLLSFDTTFVYIPFCFS